MYSQKVMIMTCANNILPKFLRFIRGKMTMTVMMMVMVIAKKKRKCRHHTVQS